MSIRRAACQNAMGIRLSLRSLLHPAINTACPPRPLATEMVIHVQRVSATRHASSAAGPSRRIARTRATVTSTLTIVAVARRSKRNRSGFIRMLPRNQMLTSSQVTPEIDQEAHVGPEPRQRLRARGAGDPDARRQVKSSTLLLTNGFLTRVARPSRHEPVLPRWYSESKRSGRHPISPVRLPTTALSHE